MTDVVRMLVLLLFILTVTLQFQAQAVALPGPSCPKSCGDVAIEYPFGIEKGCAMDGFWLNCSKTGDGRRILLLAVPSNNDTLIPVLDPSYNDALIPVLDILLLHGQVCAMKHVSTMTTRPGTNDSYDYWDLDFSDTPFTYSAASNMFVVVGSDTIAYITDDTYYSIGCASLCSPNNNLKAQDGLCSCQVALTKNMSNSYVSFSELRNRSVGGSAGSYGVIMETAAFGFNTSRPNLTDFLKAAASRINKSDLNGGRVPVILNWAIGNETCDVARNKSSYACISDNHICVDSSLNNVTGYICNCTEGYHGNPYLPHGCQGPSMGLIIMFLAISCTYLVHQRKKLASIKRMYFQQHGGRLLLQEISLKQGTSFSIFTESELIEATNKFDDENIIGRGAHGIVYKGTIKDSGLIAVKRCVSMTSEQQKKEFGKEMLILSQINHKNIVKLLGCCLEVDVPMLVYEFIPNGTLFHFIHGNSGCNIPFLTRLRISLESAQALAYLHSWASPPILHGDVKSSNILLDENYVAKVSHFGASVLAPADEAQFVTLVQGTCGYLDPEYMQTCQLTDKSDVYSFGVVLLELLTGKKAFKLDGPEDERSLSQCFLRAMKQDKLMEVIDNRIKNDRDSGLLKEVAELARQCLEMVGERRPTMRDVAEKLERLNKVMQQSWVPVEHDFEEMESLLGESSVVSLEMTSTGNFSMEKRIVQGLLESGR